METYTFSEKDEIKIHFAKDDELDSVNKMRKQVFDIHGRGEPVVFKSAFINEMTEDIYEIHKDPGQKILVAECSNIICGYAVLKYTRVPENIYMNERDFLEIDELCVDENFQRRGIGSEMIAFIRRFAGEMGFKRIELSMWEFNREALDFYEAVGFKTYRRYMEDTI